jgi:N-acyl-D-aspartate/D-glutamate deacylase
LLAFAEEHQAHSVPQVCAQPVLSAISFDGPSFAALIDGWAEAFAGYGDLSDDLRRERLTSSTFRDMLRASPENPERVTAPAFDRWRVIVSPSDPSVIGRTIRTVATDRGVDAVDVMCDLALADGLTTVIEAPLSNLDPDALRALVTADSTLLGLGDAGAHIKSITNYTYPTTVVADLAHRRGWMSLERAVQQITSRPAEVCRLEGRGVLRQGAPADVNVIDLDRLAVGPPEIVADLPGGGRRLHCSATGYDAVIVNGTVVVDHDELRPAPVGQLLRVRA